MDYRKIGSTGVKVSVIGIGTFQIGGLDTEDGLGCGWGGVSDECSIGVIHRAENLGVNLIDTADIYGNGHSEEVVGRALHGRRNRWVIATKVGFIKDPNRRGRLQDFSASHVRAACEASLKRLQTDYIDFYQLHGMPPEHQVAEAINELVQLRREGKIRFWGISTALPQYVQMLESIDNPDIVQVGFSLVDRSEEPVLDYCLQKGIGTLVRTPLSRGAAFGKYAMEKAPTFDIGDNRHGLSAAQIADQHKFGLDFRFLWEDTGRSPAQAALRFVLDRPGVTSVIPGIRTIEHLENNVGAAAVAPLSNKEIQRCDETFVAHVSEMS
jgi:myo-inositol catabolism protein IolS